VKNNRGRLINGAVLGFVFAVLVRGALGCGAGESSEAAGASNNEQASVQEQQSAAMDQQESAAAQDAVPEGIVDLENSVCPVMGNPVQEGVYTDWNGYRIHFCCAGCDQTFLSDPDKYIQILAQDPDVAEKLGMDPQDQ
jgi:hypothetical protein